MHDEYLKKNVFMMNKFVGKKFLIPLMRDNILIQILQAGEHSTAG